MTGADSLYVASDQGADGERLVPSELTRGPWSPDAQHGGPVAALVVRALELVPPDDAAHEMRTARLTLELLRPVPLAPLRVETAVLRPGKRVQVLEATVLGDDADDADRPLVRARALRVRTDDTLDVPEHVPAEPPPPPVPAPTEDRQFPTMTATWLGFHNGAMDVRIAEGRWQEPGPATAWFRLRVPVVRGEEPTPLQRLAAAADFGNGISKVLDNARFTFINPDLTIHLHRLPRGEWTCLRAVTSTSADGIGMAESALFDEHGRVGRAVQSLLLDRR